MSKNSLKVRVIEIEDTKEFGANAFKKRNLIGEINDGTYTNLYCFEFTQDKTAMLDDILPETDVTVHFNIRCRKHEAEGKDTAYFTSLNGWKIDI
jgi:hypothetical protein